ncbi:hypothetical protein [aff. Roholtiella sp. LEGE 12411]|uniref:hypothetical protein n=1 Tax=aff. Roholtiella sp. LEGE 12411 TaxID=1828822 RepID=UPI001881F2D8|nr:hypothetical protein [aff. Roholtiella sp. LEGE 12411]MBE9034905.1 hypothetical protein [aff. Roholtiella sp. LEGE 12411]
MNSLKLVLITLSGTILILFSGCANKEEENNSQNLAKPSVNNVAKTDQSSEKLNGNPADKKHSHNQGHSGQVVNLGKYHLEFKPDIEKDGTHLDVALHGEQDKEITDAKLTAQIQLPDGTKKTLEIPYKSEEDQYAALLPETATGEYKVVIQTDVNGEKLNGRFSFNRAAQE